MTAPFPLVDALDISRWVGAAAFARGRAYARDDRVGQLTWDRGAGRLRAVVRGSDGSSYPVVVDLEGAETSRPSIVSSTCECYVGSACKHAVAALLSANAAHAASVVSETRPPAVSTPPASDWRSGLTLLAPAAPAARRDARPLALRLEHRAPAARRPVRASGSRLLARPVTTGARGDWIAANLTWQNIGFQGESGGFDPRQARWFAEFHALRGTRSYVSPTGDGIALDDFESPLLWPLLDDARERGIAVVGPRGTRIEVGGAADVVVDASLDDEALRLSSAIVVDGSVYPADAVRAIGSHGVYLATSDRILIAPLTRALTPEARRSLGTTETVSVPRAELDDFRSTYYPALARRATITSADATFEAPLLTPAVLVLHASFESGDRLVIDWSWRHTGGATSELDADDDHFAPGDDAAGRREVRDAVLDVIDDHPVGTLLLANRELASSVAVRGVDAADIAAQVLPALEAIDRVELEVVGTRPEYRELVETPVLRVTAVESEQNDWFDLGVTVTVEGRTIPFRPLFTALARGAKKLLLVDKTYLSLAQPVFEPLRDLIEEAGSLDEWETGLRISRYQASLYAEFEDLADESEAAVAWREIVDGLREGAEIEPIDPPASFAGTLRPYQLDGFRWLAFLWRHRLGGILADDMGLGKTAQILALATHAVQAGSGPFLVVAPTSVVPTWASEAARFAPGLRVVTLGATSAKSGRAPADVARDADIVITTYAVARIDAPRFADVHWSALVLDEAQFVKNPASHVHRAMQTIHADARFAVTGTPIENNLGELWALLAIVAPGLFASRRGFDETYRRPIEHGLGADRLTVLRRRLRPFLLRRTKELVAPELPPKQEQVLTVELAPKHRRLYDTFLQRERQKLLGLLADVDRHRIAVFRSLTLLRLLSLDASLIDPQYAGIASAKLDTLGEHLDEVIAEGHRSLVFSQFTSFLQRVAERLDAAGVPYVYLDGATTNRAAVIDEFRGGDAPVFLISLKAGGFGLTLTEADYVFLLDPWWNPASEQQAIDRTHRIGQQKNVMVYRLVAADTIEEKVMALKQKKADLVADVLDGGAGFDSALSADDLRGLFAE
ncbi:DEAD/DEAH box helicase [Agromyces atrinae]|uniref:Superfamily II DNA or RNA helicase n=1 Tax=Agromyces atrinae TaxID=592376 RepID=A0A852RZT5_9MICO|nr:DEAD/DEAH box helicase [Agromyces atrinae]NYD65552.1 superfamily II DNA or RNA helicase [Agromyces atrinae]